MAEGGKVKKLKDMGIELPALKDAIKDLNKAKLGDAIKLSGKGETLLATFLSTIDSVPDEELGKLPKVARKFYEGLPNEAFNISAKVEEEAEETETEVEAKTEETETEVEAATDAELDDDVSTAEVHESDCPVFGKGWNAKEKDCKQCKTGNRASWASCKKATKEAKEQKKATKAE